MQEPARLGIAALCMFLLWSCTKSDQKTYRTKSQPGENPKWTIQGGDSVPVALTDSVLQNNALKILEQNCFSCHGSSGLALGGVGNITDVSYLTSSGILVPGAPEQSRIYSRIKDPSNPMPPPPTAMLDPGQLDTIRRWIIDLNKEPTPEPRPEDIPEQEVEPEPEPDLDEEINTDTNTDSDTSTGSDTENSEDSELDDEEREEVPEVEIQPEPIPEPSPSIRRFISLATEFGVVREDLLEIESFSSRKARFTRYFSLVNLHNAGHSDVRLAEHANSLSRVINSLSRERKIIRPETIDDKNLIFRIDIRDYGWSIQDWQFVTQKYHFDELSSDRQTLREFQEITGSVEAVVRADWFTYHALQPRFYHRLLNLPSRLSDLERQLRFNIRRNIRAQAQQNFSSLFTNAGRDNIVMRSGFARSGVSLSNRIIERHDLFGNGAFWISYDFAKEPLSTLDRSVKRQNIFATPLGPSVGLSNELQFDHDGGEIIFNLRNGLHGFLLVEADGQRIDVAPNEIVFDPGRPEGITNGVSCMSCHASGLLDKRDEIRRFADRLSGISQNEERFIRNLFPEAQTMTAAIEEDNSRYLDALRQASHFPELPSNSLLSLANHYESYVTLGTAAAELGLSANEFIGLVDRRANASLRNQLLPLIEGNQQMARELYEPIVEDLITRGFFGGGTIFQNNRGRQPSSQKPPKKEQGFFERLFNRL